MTSEEAIQVFEKCRERAKERGGPWCDQLDYFLSDAQRHDIVQLWNTMPGDTCFVDAFFRIMKG